MLNVQESLERKKLTGFFDGVKMNENESRSQRLLTVLSQFVHELIMNCCC